MTDTDRVAQGSYDDIDGHDEALDEWDEYSGTTGPRTNSKTSSTG